MVKKINVKQYGANGKSALLDTIGIQLALMQAWKNPIEVYIPKGTYMLLYELVIYENTTLILDDEAVLVRKYSTAMLKNGNSFKKYYGYKGNSNITIIGGTFDAYGHINNTNNTIMSIGHATNIQIKNVTFKNVVGGHAIDACGIDGFHVEGCKFLGFRDDTGERSFSEAIQIDLQVKGAFPKFGAYDGTPTKNVIIENCYFGNSEEPNMSAWNRGIGSHASKFNYFYENIHIQNNTFEGLNDYAITMLKSKQTVITNNQFKNCKGGIRYLAVSRGKYSLDDFNIDRGAQGGSNLLIGKNKFSNMGEYFAILIKSYEDSINRDIYIYENEFDFNHRNTIKFINAGEIYFLENKNINKMQKENVKDLFI